MAQKTNKLKDLPDEWQLTVREVEIIGELIQCIDGRKDDGNPKIDFDKLAQLTDLKGASSSSSQYSKIKKKLHKISNFAKAQRTAAPDATASTAGREITQSSVAADEDNSVTAESTRRITRSATIGMEDQPANMAAAKMPADDAAKAGEPGDMKPTAAKTGKPVASNTNNAKKSRVLRRPYKKVRGAKSGGQGSATLAKANASESGLSEDATPEVDARERNMEELSSDTYATDGVAANAPEMSDPPVGLDMGNISPALPGLDSPQQEPIRGRPENVAVAGPQQALIGADVVMPNNFAYRPGDEFIFNPSQIMLRQDPDGYNTGRYAPNMTSNGADVQSDVGGQSASGNGQVAGAGNPDEQQAAGP
ncbi:hypothetical protein F4861DRAFT_544860 [Xylaria intraflava]|nr:hypothetical protein F4861DRAFT_544860 [Xylaria intraflava]